jgi:hypothetical protein
MTQVTAERLHELLHYDPETGVFTWLMNKGWVRAGAVARYQDSFGYRRIMIDKRHYLAGRLAFLWMEGRWPKFEIDHNNLQPSDNSWFNLREATPPQNNANAPLMVTNTSGVKGV